MAFDMERDIKVKARDWIQGRGQMICLALLLLKHKQNDVIDLYRACTVFP